VPRPDSSLRVLVTGANGFIGAHVVRALEAAGHRVIRAVRTAAPGSGDIACDLARDVRSEDWRPRLAGVDAVVNCAGILRARRGAGFRQVHVLAPAALFGACRDAGVRRVVNVSALGNAATTGFVASKHAGDAALMALELDWVVLRPSVVYTPSGSYGGTSLLRALAALPGMLVVPGRGGQRLQPVYAADLGRVVVAAIERPECRRQIIEVAGPAPVSFEDYLRKWRAWLGLPAPRAILRVPLWLVRPVAELGERLGSGPLGMTMFRMLQEGNVAAADAPQRLERLTGVAPVSLEESLARSPAHVQDRWHARLYLLGPLLRVMLALLWIGSGIAGLALPAHDTARLAAAAGVPAPLAVAASVLDLALGAVLLTGRAVRPALWLMLASVIAYTAVIGIRLPAAWLDPFGGLLKNLAIIPALLVMLVLADRR